MAFYSKLKHAIAAAFVVCFTSPSGAQRAYYQYPLGSTPTGTEIFGPIRQGGTDITLPLSTIAPVRSVNGLTGAVTINLGSLGGLVAGNNLSDIGNASIARTNLGLSAISILSVGAGLTSSSGTLAANLQSVAGLTGTPNAAALQSALGLGSAAYQATTAFYPASGNPSNFIASNTSPTLSALSLNDASSSGCCTLGMSAAFNSSGVNIAMVGNGATTPNKYLTVKNGHFQIRNNANTAAVADIDDVGNLTGVTLASSFVSGLAPSATTDTTNASNIASGVLALGRIPTGLTSSTVALGSSVTALSVATTVAAAGNTQITATSVNAPTVYVTATGASQGVILLPAYPNTKIVNVSAYSILIYPPTNGSINGALANIAVLIYASGSAQFANTSGAAWSAG